MTIYQMTILEMDIENMNILKRSHVYFNTINIFEIVELM